METVRLRLLFERRNLLTEAQKSEGLRRAWVLLKPELETIFDVASYITHSFDLEQACPNGIQLSMDGFVLPYFESTRIFKDKDIIRVKRKGDVMRIGDAANSLEDSEIVEKQPVTGVKLLALEEFEKETGDYQSEPEENEDIPETALPTETLLSGKTTSKKRKSSTKLHSAKRKKISSTSPEQSPKVLIEGVEYGDQAKSQLPQKSSSKKDRSSKTNVKAKKACSTDVSDGDENIVKKKRIRSVSPEKSPKLTNEGIENEDCANNKDSNYKGVLSLKSASKKDKSSKTKAKFKRISVTDVGIGVENSIKHMPHEDRNVQIQENNAEDVEERSAIPEGTVKRPSRTSRRKKLKRKWLRENKELIKSNMLEESIHDKSQELQEFNRYTNSEAEVVPIVVKPGHIRFEPISEDEVVRQSPDPMGTFRWNGTMSKKKGQKWGMEKTSGARSNSYENNSKDPIEKPPVEEGEFVHDTVNFEKLNPFSGLPKEGDVVAYRLLELSTSWSPELSPFRVGKISWFDSTSNDIILLPVPGYPIVSDERGDEAIDKQSGSLYREDGSLEIDFASLVDVRVFNSDNMDPATTVTVGSTEALASSKEAGSGVRSNDNHDETTVITNDGTKTPVNNNQSVVSNGNPGETHSLVVGNGKQPDIWEEMSQALSEKKSQLLKEDGWSKKVSSSSGRWSYKGLRSGAVGPTVNFLRAGSGKR